MFFSHITSKSLEWGLLSSLGWLNFFFARKSGVTWLERSDIGWKSIIKTSKYYYGPIIFRLQPKLVSWCGAANTCSPAVNMVPDTRDNLLLNTCLYFCCLGLAWIILQPQLEHCAKIACCHVCFLNTFSRQTFANGAFTGHHTIGINIGDVDGQIPSSAVHSSGYSHAQRFIQLLGEGHCLLVTSQLLAWVLAKKKL